MNGGAYIRVEGVGGLISGIKKRFQTSHGSVDRETFLG